MATRRETIKYGVVLIFLTIFLIFYDGFMDKNQVLALETGSDSFEMEVNLYNNSISVFDIFSSYENAIKQENSFPTSITAAGSFSLQFGLEKNDDISYGFLIRKMGWLLASGETAQFYRDASDPTFTNQKLYNLGVNFESLSIIGLYQQKEFKTGRFECSLEEDFFICFDYHKLKATGNGLLTKGTDGKKKIDIFGSYEQSGVDRNGVLGFGGSLSWQTALKFSPKMEFDLKIRNLPGIIYFPSLTSENGNVDSSLESIGPIAINGFIRKNSIVLIMPVEIQGSFLFQILNGTGELQVFSIGEVCYTSMGYLYSLNDHWEVEMAMDPVNYQLSAGCIFPGGKFKIIVDPQNNWTVGGVIISFRI
jgi:hypothetical protein